MYPHENQFFRPNRPNGELEMHGILFVHMAARVPPWETSFSGPTGPTRGSDKTYTQSSRMRLLALLVAVALTQQFDCIPQDQQNYIAAAVQKGADSSKKSRLETSKCATR